MPLGRPSQLAPVIKALKGASDEQTTSARARTALARADLDALLKEPDYDVLQAGATASELDRAEINVALARLALESARA